MTGRKENFLSNVYVYVNVELKLNFELKIVNLVQIKTNMTDAGGVFSPA